MSDNNKKDTDKKIENNDDLNSVKEDNINENKESENLNRNEEVNNEITHNADVDLTDSKAAAKNVDELLEKYDLDSSKLRKLSGKTALIVTIVAILMSAFHLFTAARGTLLAMQQRSLPVSYTHLTLPTTPYV